jgi:RES domain-containing protein
MKVYRLSTSKYQKDLEGIGAKLSGGRWNNKGLACIYSSESRALAVLEYAANIELDLIPRALNITTYEIPEMEFITFNEKDLPGDWRLMPSTQSTKDFGSIYLKDPEVLGIKVPSTVVPEEYNYLINPGSNKVSKITILDAKDFVFDVRVKS